MVRTSLLCGQGAVELKLPDSVKVLEIDPLPALADPEAAVEAALARPIAGQPLAELARGRRSACLVVSDFTRPVPNRVILPPLLASLEAAGLERRNITLLIATGMHRPNLGPELVDLVGPEIAADYRIVNHYCRRPETLGRVTEIDGAPIEVNLEYLQADLKILTGLVEPHMYAGYSGGRKSILPGISGFETMKFMHSFVMIAHPRVRNCLLEGNPFHEAGLKVSQAVGVDFILNVVVDKERQLAGVFAGDLERAHLAGCELVRRHSVKELDQRADLVITSGGGYPLDATFYQVSKGLTVARDMLRPGGTILIAAECREGLGGAEFSELMRSGLSTQEFDRRYSRPENFVIDQWCVQTVFQARDQAGRILVYSPGLSRADLEAMGMVKIEDPQAAAEGLLAEHERVLAVPEGPYLVGLAAEGA